MFLITFGLLSPCLTLVMGICVHDISTKCHDFTKDTCSSNQWMQTNCCEYCGLNSGSHPVNGNWGPWSHWGSCSVSCGNGTMHRTRLCDNPAPAHGGAACHGHHRDTQACSPGHCPVYGHWSSWTNWSSCSASCDNGTMKRSRDCDNPAPSNGGSQCTGSSVETQTCQIQSCHEGLTCLSCQGAIFPHTCDSVEHCGSHSVCSMERYFDGSGNLLYNLGCRDAAFCHSTSIRAVPDTASTNASAGADYKRNAHVPQCRECCTTSMCNSAGCGTTGYTVPRGPVCYACTQQLTLNSCNTIQLCGRDEDCHIEGKHFGSVHYFTSGCKAKAICEGAGPIGRAIKDSETDKKRQTFSCQRCCINDLCNHQTC